MILNAKQFKCALDTLNETIYSPIGLILEGKNAGAVREERIMRLLNEGIVSKEVIDAQNEAFTKFLNDLNQHSDRKNGVTISVDCMLGNKNISVTFVGKNTINPDEVTKPEGQSVFRCGGMMIYIQIDFVLFRGRFKNSDYEYEVKRAVLHELDHVYKQFMTGHAFYHSDLTSVSNTNIKSANEADRMLAHIVYASNSDEQDAMCAELYQQCIDVGRMALNRFEEKPNAYEWLENLYVAHDYLLKHKDDPSLIQALGRYRDLKQRNVDDKWETGYLPDKRVKKPFDKSTWNYKKFRQRSEEGIKRFEMRIAQTLKKANREMFGEVVQPFLYKRLL